MYHAFLFASQLAVPIFQNEFIPLARVQGVQGKSRARAQPRLLPVNKHNLPFFRLGDVYITPNAQAALAARSVNPAALLDRHATDDWSNLSADDIEANRDTIDSGLCVFSSYHNTQKI